MKHAIHIIVAVFWLQLGHSSITDLQSNRWQLCCILQLAKELELITFQSYYSTSNSIQLY